MGEFKKLFGSMIKEKITCRLLCMASRAYHFSMNFAFINSNLADNYIINNFPLILNSFLLIILIENPLLNLHNFSSSHFTNIFLIIKMIATTHNHFINHYNNIAFPSLGHSNIA